MIERAKLRDLVYALDGDVADLPFWEGCERGEFLLIRCEVCGRHAWPAADCPQHGGGAMRWVPASGRGSVHVHTVIRRGRNGATGEAAPFAVAVVALTEGPFFHTNLVGIPADKVRAGLEVAVTFVTHANGMTVPVFRPHRDADDNSGLDRPSNVS